MATYGDSMLWLAPTLLALAGGLLGALARATGGMPTAAEHGPEGG